MIGLIINTNEFIFKKTPSIVKNEAMKNKIKAGDVLGFKILICITYKSFLTLLDDAKKN